jgi:protein-S-isoprenylcysteine O-methyltransferase Ste14
MLGRIFRVVSGFFIACLAAALAKVMFAFAGEMQRLPSELVADRLALAFPIATHMAIFSAPMALILLAFAEGQRWRGWLPYAAIGIGIALVGFFAQYTSETGQEGWSVLNDAYLLTTFVSAGLAGGLAYWLTAGRLAGIEAEMRPYERSVTTPR